MERPVEPAANDRRLPLIDSTRITSIERTGTAKMTATKEANAWKIQADGASFPADKPTIDATLRAWDALQADKIAAYGKDAKLEELMKEWREVEGIREQN